MQLNLRIRELRKERGLTLADLAGKVGVSTPHMSEVERGKKNLNNHLLERISEALGVHPTQLLGDTESQQWNSLKSIVEDLSRDDQDRVLEFALGLRATSKQR
jgi:transcriptional regulator with XRE-family HTH domain